MANVLYLGDASAGMLDIIEAVKPKDITISYWCNLEQDAQEKAIESCAYFLVSLHKVSKEMLLRAKNLKMIQTTGAAVDNIDLGTAKALGITVANTPADYTTSIAELTLGLILNLFYKLRIFDQAANDQEKTSPLGLKETAYEIRGKVHGIFGCGKVGQEVARLTQAFGAKILYHDLRRLPEELEIKLNADYVSFDELLKKADIISLHTPLTPITRNCLSHREFTLMRSSAILVNVSCGNIVDENALYHALCKQEILGAAIDIWAKEPVGNNPLLGLDNILLATPHIGTTTREALQSELKMAFLNIQNVSEGKKSNYVVNG
ncbi:NAD(P)-dependent oxidoreductase [Sporomusa aerivorans]|uniref:NAD(P)-dependent oxidoreductase n=1 Tax=Sporomusa aerivorans TaxID=204936 RepID=UPI00352B1964